MSSKPESVDNRHAPLAMRLGDTSVLALSGRDAAAFAQSQFTSDVAALADLHWQWSAWLTPKGRVLALFQLLRLDAERYWAILRDQPAQALGDALKRFVFRSKVTIEAPSLQVIGERGGGTSGDAPVATRDGECVRLILDRDRGRALRIVPASDAPEATPAALADWMADDIATGLPRLAGAALDAWTPQMLGLDRIGAYSLKKGCYPGQEIVSRTHYLGQAKRGLARLRLLAPAAVGERLQGADGGSAEIVCSATSGGIEQALAVTTLEPAVDVWRDATGTDRALPQPLHDTLVH